MVKVNKRFARRYQFQASYAFQKATTVSVWDDTNWFAGYGEYLPHHNLTVSGYVDLPWGFQLSLNSSFISRTPNTASVSNLFLPGTVQAGSTEPLPGLGYGSLNAGTSRADLASLVDAFNSKYANTKNAQGGTIAPLILPSDYQFGDPFFSQDFRLTKKFTFKERYGISIFGEMFNAFNIANLTYPGGAFTLDSKAANPATQTFAFGQPTQRVLQTFGSGGPRAVQIGARFTF